MKETYEEELNKQARKLFHSLAVEHKIESQSDSLPYRKADVIVFFTLFDEIPTSRNITEILPIICVRTITLFIYFYFNYWGLTIIFSPYKANAGKKKTVNVEWEKIRKGMMGKQSIELEEIGLDKKTIKLN